MSLTIEQLESLQKGTTTLRMLVKIIPRNGASLRVCLHTANIVFAGETYAASGFVPAQTQKTGDLNVSNTEFTALLRDGLNSLDLRGGRWQGAKVEIYIVDFRHLERGAIFTEKGRFGMATINGRQVTMEYRSLKALLNQTIGFTYSRICRDVLGGFYCAKNTSAFTHVGTVLSAANNQKFTVSVSQPDGYFYRGKITFNAGANAGLAMDVQMNTGNLITLFEPMPGDVAAGDSVTLVAGCDGTLKMCHEKFNNAVNHFAEDCIPETSRMVKVIG